MKVKTPRQCKKCGKKSLEIFSLNWLTVCRKCYYGSKQIVDRQKNNSKKD